MLAFLLLAGLVAAEHQLPPRSTAQRDSNTVLVIWGTRHGNRHPEKFLEENPRTWGYEGATELTSFGKRQGYGLGQELRRFVGQLVDNNYNNTEVKYFSSSANRCQMTLQTALAAFHKPSTYGVWNKEVLWSPVPYSVDDPVVRMYAVDDCPANKKVWKPIDTDSLAHLAAKKKEKKALIEYCEKNSWKMDHLGKMADLADNLIEIDLYKAKYPKWISNPTLKGYNGERLKKEIMEFGEIHQIGCADYEPCRSLMAGYWLQKIVESLENAAAEKKGPRVIGYAGHTETTLALMKLLGYEREELNTSAGFVMELRKSPTPGVRLLNHDPNPIDGHVIYSATLKKKLKASKDGFIPLTDFLNFIKPKAIKDWKKACKA